MKSGNPNPLFQALANQAASDHPDPDLLTAFAEGSLLARERESVMTHLAGCAECRGVLSLSATEFRPEHELELVAAAAAMPMAAAAEPAPAATTQRQRRLRGWRWPAWAAAAACAAIISIVALRLAYKKTAQTASAPESNTVAVNTTPAAPEARPAASAQPQERQRPPAVAKKATPATALQIAPQAAATSQNGILPAPQLSAQGGSVSNQMASRRAQVNADSLAALNMPREESGRQSLPQESTRMALHGQVLPPAPAAPPASSGSPQGLVPSMAGSFAKSASAGRMTHPHWRINDDGRVERAFADGQWQLALANESAHMHVVSVTGADVWAGGEHDVLYRSRDDGATWQRVALPQKNGMEHTITQIRFDNAVSGTIQAEDGTTWTTTDGGMTWQ